MATLLRMLARSPAAPSLRHALRPLSSSSPPASLLPSILSSSSSSSSSLRPSPPLDRRHTHSHAPQSLACWSCGAALAANARLVCARCGLGQPTPPGTTYFDVFGLPAVYDVDPAVLRRNFLALQQAVHPDRVTLESERVRVLSDALSSLVNKAHNTLRDPLARALYLLSLHGDPDGGAKPTDQAFLMQLLEERERLEAATTADEVAQLCRENDARVEAAVATMEKAFRANDLAAAREATAELQYWVSLQDAIRDWEPA